MADKGMLSDNFTVNIPLQYNDETETKLDTDSPPPYELPQLDFSGGWKDRGFAIVFWIHTVAVILVGLILGVPVLISLMKDIKVNELEQVSAKFDFKPFIYGLSAAVGVGGLASLLKFSLLQACAGQLIKCSFLVIIMMQIILGVILFFILWPLCFIPVFFLLIILIYLSCVRKRISFAEAHLQAGCASLRNHPSLILIALVMLIVELLWFIFWFLMALGVQHTLFNSTSFMNFNTNDSVNSTTKLDMTSTKPLWIKTTNSGFDGQNKLVNSTPFWMKEKQTTKTMNIYSINQQGKYNNTQQDSTNSTQEWYSGYVRNIILFLLLLSWYWGAITFGNIAHFVTACAVGEWWFTGEASEQYSLGSSIKRAFTTNFGTICFGSLFEALIKAARSVADDKRQKSILSCIFVCILRILEKVIGYLNEWAFIFAALTGQGFVQASRSFIDLFKQRGWTVIINDTLVGTTLMLINLGIGLISAAAAGLIIYLLISDPLEKLAPIIIIVFISFLIGVLMSSIITTILTSCVRTVVVCFALNPAALGATHPDYLKKLTEVWHKVYAQEFANSGYAKQFVEPMV
ncbi:unnamed protein product [Rotaria sp. Silwood2]|nr:unnamed protein product [Rotaria sp. Silwood2]